MLFWGEQGIVKKRKRKSFFSHEIGKTKALFSAKKGTKDIFLGHNEGHKEETRSFILSEQKKCFHYVNQSIVNRRKLEKKMIKKLGKHQRNEQTGF